LPTYDFVCEHCKKRFDKFSSSFIKTGIGHVHTDIECEHCGKKKAKRVWPEDLSAVSMSIAEGDTREDRKEREHRKKTKCRERAEKNRKALFGSAGVSITKSEHYHKEKRIKAKGTSQDIDKQQFIKMAAQNPNAVAAARKIVGK
jgi:hypothetical protein